MSTPLNDTLAVERQVPRSFSFTKPYWDGTREKKLLVQYCKESGRYQIFPKPISGFTGSLDLEWREVTGKGEVYAYTTAEIARPPFAGHAPYLIGTITLDEGVNFVANIIHCSSEQVRVGLRVRVAWVPLEDGTHIAVFEPDEGEGR